MAEFESMRKNLTSISLNWTALIPRLQGYESDFNRLAPHQKIVFQEYWLPRFYTYVDICVGGSDRFYGNVKYVWNTHFWLRILLKLSQVKEREDDRDCLISVAMRNRFGRPSVNLGF